MANYQGRCHGSHRRNFFICSVVFIIVFLLYTLEDMSSWSTEQPRKNPTRLLELLFKSRTHHLSSNSSSGTNSNTLKSKDTLTSSTAAHANLTTSSSRAAVAASNAATASSDSAAVAGSGPKCSTTNPKPSAIPRLAPVRDTNASIMTQQAKRSATERPKPPVPDVSLGAYLVEYPSEYHFLINEPRRCEQERPFVVLVVPVAFDNRAQRDVIRRTWGSERSVLGKPLAVFFLLGAQQGGGGGGRSQVEPRLAQESAEHRDLIQSDFVESYRNLTIKTMVMLEWLDSFCAGASYAMKVDSDVFLNVENLVKMLLAAPRTDYMTGHVAANAAVHRWRGSKWFLPTQVYPRPSFPRYALGLGYVLSLDLPKKLTEASRHVKALYIEDVYLGLCMQHVGLAPADPPDPDYFHFTPVAYGRCRYSKIVATTTEPGADLMRLWSDFKKPGPYC